MRKKQLGWNFTDHTIETILYHYGWVLLLLLTFTLLLTSWWLLLLLTSWWLLLLLLVTMTLSAELVSWRWQRTATSFPSALASTRVVDPLAYFYSHWPHIRL